MIKKLKNVTLLDIKNNLAVILLFPTVLGGVWQLLELSKMSISFIRFFSPTQLLPDGLLILFMLSMMYVAVQLGLLDKKINFKRKIIKVSEAKTSDFLDYYIKPISINKLAFIDNPIYRKDLIWSEIGIIIGGFLLMVFFFDLISSSNEESIFLSFIILLTLFVMIGKMLFTSIIILSVFFMDNKYNRIKEYFVGKPTLKELSFIPLKIFLILSLFVIFLLLPFKVLSFFHKEYMLPRNLKNLDSISCSLNDNNYTSNKISYLNDKYIFIEHTTEDKNITIEILKFDSLFKSK